MVLDRIRVFFEQLDARQFIMFAASVGAALLLTGSLLLYFSYRSTRSLTNRITVVNKYRREARDLFERYEIVKKQQTDVDAILEKDTEFKIGEYFNTVMQQLNNTSNKTREPSISSDMLDNGYTEIKLYASFSNFNMQKLAELLDTLEQNERIYVKELEIYKLGQENSINVNILIATLEPKGESAETVE